METEATIDTNDAEQSTRERKRGLFGRFRRNRSKQKQRQQNQQHQAVDKREQTPSPPLEKAPSNESPTGGREGVVTAVVSPEEAQRSPTDSAPAPAPASAVGSQAGEEDGLVGVREEEGTVGSPVPSPSAAASPRSLRVDTAATPKSYSGLSSVVGASPSSRLGQHRSPRREEFVLETPPPAREAAFSGPPRYDWIDIETAAAIKVQAAYRRSRVMKDMERRGLTTAAIRNRSRRLRKRTGVAAGGEDVPSLFRCCGMGLAFGDATEEDENYEAARQYQKAQYEKDKLEKEAAEEELRERFRKAIWDKKKAAAQADEEAYEVVEQ